jgi:hypothetical protein
MELNRGLKKLKEMTFGDTLETSSELNNTGDPPRLAYGENPGDIIIREKGRANCHIRYSSA